MSKVLLDFEEMRAIVLKPAVEKYARKLIQEQLKALGKFGWMVEKNCMRNGEFIPDEYDDRWEFDLWSPWPPDNVRDSWGNPL